jgi:hypothetical protein
VSLGGSPHLEALNSRGAVFVEHRFVSDRVGRARVLVSRVCTGNSAWVRAVAKHDSVVSSRSRGRSGRARGSVQPAGFRGWFRGVLEVREGRGCERDAVQGGVSGVRGFSDGGAIHGVAAAERALSRLESGGAGVPVLRTVVELIANFTCIEHLKILNVWRALRPATSWVRRESNRDSGRKRN